MRTDIEPGTKFPDYELPDHTGTPRKLSEIQGRDPMCLLLAREWWCPREHYQHAWMAAMEDEIDVALSKIVTISPTEPALLGLWRMRLGAHWPFLSDEELQVQSDLDIAEYTSPRQPASIPHTIMLEPGLIVYKVYMGYWYWARPTPEELRQDMRAMTKRARPDWDITTPRVRKAWQKGDRSSFWPYG